VGSGVGSGVGSNVGSGVVSGVGSAVVDGHESISHVSSKENLEIVDEVRPPNLLQASKH
jgi:hypothetical protein